MDKDNRVCRTVNEYIAGFPPEVQDILQTIRAIIKEEAPAAIERIAYGMPTYTMEKYIRLQPASKPSRSSSPATRTPKDRSSFRSEPTSHLN